MADREGPSASGGENSISPTQPADESTPARCPPKPIPLNYARQKVRLNPIDDNWLHPLASSVGKPPRWSRLPVLVIVLLLIAAFISMVW